MKIKAFKVLALIICMLLLPGCWDRKEIVDQAIILTTTIDVGKSPNKYLFHSHIAEPKQLGGEGQSGTEAQTGKSSIAHMRIEARSIDESRFIAENMLSRDIVTSHRRVLIIGEALARQGIEEFLDQVSRNPKNRINTLLIISKNMPAYQLLDVNIPLEALPQEAFYEIAVRKAHTPTSLRDYFISSTTPGVQPFALAYTKKFGKISFNGLAIFQDHKLIGFLNVDETQAFTSLLGKRSVAGVMLKFPEQEGGVSVMISKIKVARHVSIVDHKPQFSFKVKAEGQVTDNTANVDLFSPKILNQLNKQFEKEIQRHYTTLFHTLQKKFGVDSAGLGAMIYKKYPNYWNAISKEWNTMYREQKIQWDIQAEITNVGAIGPPLYNSSKSMIKK
ncbi:Ger(x)C family spore germination protein [Paenibacillus paeoniae]|uniref:Ger(X)C family spore germination protein n=1 Tax=Paenibacillus paeoniae TaxID=2292705 RepID=A0A371PKS1_9BACL|nr:Ger(x)C family spore germination protein [Paenibacillus paeoniae]REK76788.1 Ger(x)C family spore germination protein [Paenibacillus paeoniae]